MKERPTKSLSSTFLSLESPFLLSDRINSKFVLEFVLATEIIESIYPKIALFLMSKPDSNFNTTSTLSSKETVGLTSSPIANRADSM
ncbi:MAG: hypothetical protein PHE28_03480 [Bacteroidales bacterium]|nr:hypothetical protein [Bacteroidales bacterium]